MIDTSSPAGSYALAIAHSPNLRVEEYYSYADILDRNLNARKALRPYRQEAAQRGVITRKGKA